MEQTKIYCLEKSSASEHGKSENGPIPTLGSFEKCNNKVQKSVGKISYDRETKYQIDLNQRDCPEEKRGWSPSEDWKLFKLKSDLDLGDWGLIANQLEARSHEACRKRWEFLVGSCKVTGGWGDFELKKLARLLFDHGFAWTLVRRQMPLRSVNLIKGFVYASFRQLKNKRKVIFWYLQNIVRWPTFTNASRPPLPPFNPSEQKQKHFELLEKNRRKIKLKFERLLPLFKSEFERHNRLTQEIIRQLLEMDYFENEFNQKLIKQVFGPLTLKKFKTFGNFSRYESEKKILLNYIKLYLGSVDQARMEKIDFFEKSRLKKNEKKNNKSWKNGDNNNIKKNNFEEKFVKNVFISKSQKNQKNSCKKRKENTKKIIRVMIENRVKLKYVEHWIWLRKFFGSESEEFQSFHLLVFSGYNILSQQKKQEHFFK